MKKILFFISLCLTVSILLYAPNSYGNTHDDEFQKRNLDEKFEEAPSPEILKNDGYLDNDVSMQTKGGETTQSADSQLLNISRITASSFKFNGNEAISNDELQTIAKVYADRPITFEELQELCQKITLYYVNKGYVNSGAVIEDQEIKDSTIVITIKEGSVKEINVSGNKRLSSGYIRKRLLPYAKTPANVYELQRGLQILQQNPRIETIKARFNPDVTPGEAILDLDIKEARPYSIWAEIDNNNSPSIGSEGASVGLAHNNVMGYGDTFSGKVGVTFEGGLFESYVRYNFPLNSMDTTLHLEMERNYTKVIEQPFKDLDIISRSDSYGVAISHPIYRTVKHDLVLGLKGQKRRSRTYLLEDIMWSFSEGAEHGRTKMTVLRFFQEWLYKSQNEVINVISSLNLGIDAFNATIHDDLTDGRFFSWLAQGQYMRRIGKKDKQLLINFGSQLANESLFPLEQFSVGGMYSVKGYRKNEIVRDSGFFLSCEFRIPVVNYSYAGGGQLQLAPFIDYGRGWNVGHSTPYPKQIASTGLGLRWKMGYKINLNVYGAIPLNNIEHADEDLQDQSVHFQLRAEIP